jgi:hypothetical protein
VIDRLLRAPFWVLAIFDRLDLRKAKALLDELHAWQPISKQPELCCGA